MKLLDVFRKTRVPKSIPYLAILDIPTSFTFPKDFRIDEFKGLQLCYIVSLPPKSKQLIVMWEDEPHYRLYHDSLRNKLSLLSPIAAGFVAEVVQAKETLWTWYSWKELLIGAAAVVAAISFLHSHFADLFDPADAKVVFADMAPVDVNENSAFNSQILVLNEDTYASTKVTNVEASANCPAGAVTVTPNAANPPVIAPAQQVSIRLDGVAPRRRSSGAFDECDLSVRVFARTGIVPGFLTGPGSFSSVKVVRVWPTRISWSGLTVSTTNQSNTNPTRYLQARFTIYPGIGYAAGAKGSIAVTSSVDENVEVTTGREIEKLIPLPVSPASHQSLIHKFDFQTRSLERFQPLPVSVGLVAKSPISSKRWQEVVQQSEVNVQWGQQ
jgi:hypothetical protein